MSKRALVVDDSRSARAFLARILERHQLEVDSAESAEEAIEYLTRHRPDVIFMDHLMPGMDGFQAVQAIKNNPRTATIPILMYTSQEGELYLGQARALGAIGVLPKQIRPADVTTVLHQLHLLEDRRVNEPRPVPNERRRAPEGVWPAEAGPQDPTHRVHTLADGGASTAAALGAGAASSEPEGLTPPAEAERRAGTPAEMAVSRRAAAATPLPAESLLRDQISELRRALMARLDEQQELLDEQLRGTRQAVGGATAPAAVSPLLPPAPTPAAAPDRRGWAAAVLAGFVALLFAALWWREAAQRVALQQQLARLAASPVVASPAAEGAPAANPPTPPAAAAPASSGVPAAGIGGAGSGSAAPASAPALPASPVSFAVPFGQAPLADDRVGAVRRLLEDLRRAGVRGDVEVQVLPGRFCLIGSAGEGYSLPPDDLPVERCDRFGNPAQDGGAMRESLPFANMLAEQRQAAGGQLRIRVLDPADRPLQPYPDSSGGPTAGQWNAIAAANNRVELRWRERP